MNKLPGTFALVIVRALFMLMLAVSPEPAFSTSKPTQELNPIIGKKVRVEDQQGRRLNFFSDLVKDKIVAINFIYTRCTGSCPLSTAVFSKVQQQTKNRPVQLISISLDPTMDSPEQLRNYAASFKAGPNWHFVTGGQASINDLLKTFGVYAADRDTHTNMVVIGNEASGRWLRLYGLPSADDIAAALDHVR